MSPQFHVIYDRYFHTVQGTSSLDPTTYLEKLFHTTARWLHVDPYTHDPHLFESFWHDEAGMPTSRKRKFSCPESAPLRGSLDPDIQGNSTPTLRGSTDSDPLQGSPDGNHQVASHTTTANTASPHTPGLHATGAAWPTKSSIHVAHLSNPHLHTPQYDYIDRTSEFTSYKRTRGIDGAILVLVAHTP